MAFLIDTQELKPGLIIFRRGDVKHHNWYCRNRPEGEKTERVVESGEKQKRRETDAKRSEWIANYLNKRAHDRDRDDEGRER
jgi:hypothetical protein